MVPRFRPEQHSKEVFMSRSSRQLPFIISGILAAAIISPAAPAFAAPAAEDNILSELQALADAPTKTPEQKLQEAKQLLKEIEEKGGAAAYIKHEGEEALKAANPSQEELDSFIKSSPKEHAEKELKTAIDATREEATKANQYIKELKETKPQDSDAFVRAAQKVQSALYDMRLWADWLSTTEKVAKHYQLPTDDVANAFTPTA
ncbi:hypothetical protein A4R63_09840 [Corynebacterium pseudotuberculosis]|nr:hypothetical protein CP31_10280 [Corynebacterium pseudotuberculosis 31]APB11726.1 hypothetical protein A4R72_10075 [Corynebacterium pseudotuberculosis]APB13770.1 hypothetical protein A4R71_10090 [Corynebacterium pseudotuberculosis]APB15813.1 hypothetical protein A4R68_10090 [Corynebacterium pseudotuberculosis]APB17858.1 hypothetical protein A4R67_10065 [Corynebacterium pseudotuberculosis]